MKPVIRKGLVAPGIVAFVTLLVWAVLGPRWALAALGIGAAAIIGFHLYQLQLVTDWAADRWKRGYRKAAASGPRRSPCCIVEPGCARRCSAI